MKVLFLSRNVARVDQLVLALRLRWPDIRPLVDTQGGMCLQIVEKEKPDLVLVGEDLPNLSIWEAITEVRKFSDIPIIVAARGEDEMDVVRAIELGADDYIRLPCDLMEVMARVVALMRRVGLTKQRSDEAPIRCGELLINPATYEVFLGSERLLLTPTEFKLLHLLAKNRHMTLSHEFIQRVIWADDVEAGKVLTKYIQRLRRKLADDASDPIWIKTRRGVGYRFTPSAPLATEAPAVT